MNVLLFGKNGQLGWEIKNLLCSKPTVFPFVLCVDVEELNLADSLQLKNFLTQTPPIDVIINAAAYTDVDKAEAEPHLAAAVNTTAPALMAEEAKKRGILFFHYSTDYIFDGSKQQPYQEEDLPNPLNEYGRTKLDGEKAVLYTQASCFIFRTSWVYSLRGNTFVNKVLRWARQYNILNIVDDQISNPTWAKDLAEALVELLTSAHENGISWLIDKKGIYHLTSQGYASRYDWALQIIKNDPLKNEHIVKEIRRAKSKDFPTPAIRPLFSALSNKKFFDVFGFNLPVWQNSLTKALSLNDIN